MSEALLTDRRDHVIDRLSSDYANGLLEVDELERRLAIVYAARTPAEIDVAVVDLVPAATTALAPVQRLRIVMSSTERTGPWSPPSHLAARVFWGNLRLDLREARLPPGGLTIDVDVTMGNVEVIVAPGVACELGASPLLANIEQRTEPGSKGDGPIVRIVGRVKLGNLEVSTRRPGQTRRDTWRRHRAERRAWRRWRRALRPPLDW